MGITIIVKGQPRHTPVRFEPPRGLHKHREVIIPCFGGLDRSEQQELIESVNEETGRHHTEDEMQAQIEQRVKGTYKKTPSLKRKMRTGEW